jgi:hypothetical protein
MRTKGRLHLPLLVGELTDRIVTYHPEPITKLNPKIPPEFDPIVAGMLAKERSERYGRSG